MLDLWSAAALGSSFLTQRCFMQTQQSNQTYGLATLLAASLTITFSTTYWFRKYKNSPSSRVSASSSYVNSSLVLHSNITPLSPEAVATLLTKTIVLQSMTLSIIKIWQERDTNNLLLSLEVSPNPLTPTSTPTTLTVPLVSFCASFNALYSSNIIRTTTYSVIADLTGTPITSLFSAILPSLFQIPIIPTPWLLPVGERAKRASLDEGEKYLRATTKLTIFSNQFVFASSLLGAACAASTDILSLPSTTSVLQTLFNLTSLSIDPSIKTVAFVLPSLSTISPLLRPLKLAFGHDRQVFAYSSCSSATTFPQSTPKSVPISTMSHISPQLPPLLSLLPSTTSNVVESWLSAVDAFTRLKEEKVGRANPVEYLPFVLKFEILTNSMLSLQNVIQFNTGRKSRPFDASTVTAMTAIWEKWRIQWKAKIDVKPSTKVLISEIVFCHKSILLDNKTLPDTCQPAEGWSLKAARKTVGCSCCAEEEDSDEENGNFENDSDNKGENWNDGKLGFVRF